MKKLTVIAAGLGAGLLERRHATKIAGLSFGSAPSVFPAVTCVAQATLRTGLTPTEHGIWSNGIWSDDLHKPVFWEQNARLVKGTRVWEAHRAAGARVGVFFFQQSLGESVDAIISPAPIHCHGGGMTMACYTKPVGMTELMERACGTFPLWRYWGPLASPKVGRRCIAWCTSLASAVDLDEAWLYLPTLDYAAQKSGPDSSADVAAFREFRHQLEMLADFCQRQGCALSVRGDYEITPVTSEPVLPNVTLRQAGLFKVRPVKTLAYPDFYESEAFAICDHEFCRLHGSAADRAREVLLATGDYEDASVGGQIILLARAGSWCDYRWWTDRREAPDFASHVDIHNKPGFDPRELFFFNRGTVKGTHGRPCQVALSEE